jgi:8-oxo-dGTP pyrophosphatase MutT (NUDIX family)/phosphohistidine phosphatase SixA
MAEVSADGEIRAAGAVLWRPSDAGVEVALVHRSRYDDWSFPKGKRFPGEHVLLTAVREVGEETGVRAVLGRPLPPVRYESFGRPKLVDYWTGRPSAGDQAPFRPNDEVDALAWLPLPDARARLSYGHDVTTLDEFAAGPADTVPLVFLRHAAAGHKDAWPGNDLDRPLDARGAADADWLAPLLACFAPRRVISSAAERCVATVRPYAALTGSAVALEPAFTVALSAQDTGSEAVASAAVASAAVASAAVAEIVTAGVAAVICAHGENLPALITDACAALGAVPPDGLPLPKSGFWVLHLAGGALAAAERHRLAER